MKIPTTVPVTVITVLEDLTQIAVGLCNGTLVLFKGDILREKNVKQYSLQADTDSPITGLGYKIQNKNTILFVVTSDSVVTFYTHQKDIYKEVLDDNFGCGVGCCVMGDEQDLVIARKEAVYFYESDGRGPCFAFEGDKKLVYWFRGYFIIIGQDSNNNKFNTFTIYDLKNKFIAYSENRFQNITNVVSEWGSIFVFTQDGKLFQLEEKDTQTKLETLFKKNLYSVAINLAHSQNLDYASIIDIFRKYGDHLYVKGDYDGSIAQYIKTIGKLEPSYVIRKFLDAQRIHNLTSYLQALHEKGLANADHTTLLFNCYTKLKDVLKLDQFIKTESEMNFDVETAIKACRQAGYYQHALYLAEKHSQHLSYLKILLEDLRGYNDALDYISTLDFYEAEQNLKKYGKILVTNLPEQTTEILKRLCTNYTSRSLLEDNNNNNSNNNNNNNSGKVVGKAEEYIHLYVNQPEWLIKFLEYMITKPNPSTILFNTLLELYLRDETIVLAKDSIITNNGNTNNNNSNNNNSNGGGIIYSSGSSNILTETIVTKRTLTSEEMKNRRKLALNLIMNVQYKYEDEYALVLCKLHNFQEGIIYLYEKLQLYQEIVEYYMEHNKYSDIISTCKQFGNKEPNLWIQSLNYFAIKTEDCTNEISEILTNIDRSNLLPPLMVIQILSKKSTATLSLIKEYITRRLHTENQLITEDAKQIKDFTDETKKMKGEITELKTSAKIFQLNKCTYCSSPLDLPAVHFLCMHSFHQRCLGENESECPNCAPQNKKILEIKRSLEENVNQHDEFFRRVCFYLFLFSLIYYYIVRKLCRWFQCRI